MPSGLTAIARGVEVEVGAGGGADVPAEADRDGGQARSLLGERDVAALGQAYSHGEVPSLVDVRASCRHEATVTRHNAGEGTTRFQLSLLSLPNCGPRDAAEKRVTWTRTGTATMDACPVPTSSAARSPCRRPSSCGVSRGRPGPGGQHVNTSDSQVELRFDLATTEALPEVWKDAGAGAAGRAAGRRGRHRTGLRAPLPVAQPRDRGRTAGRAAGRGDGAAAASRAGRRGSRAGSTSAGCGRRSSAATRSGAARAATGLSLPAARLGLGIRVGRRGARLAAVSPAAGSGPGSTSAARRPRSAGAAVRTRPIDQRVVARPRTRCSVRHSRVASAPPTSGAPDTSPRVYGMSSKRSRSLIRPFIAKRPAMCRWLSREHGDRPQRLFVEQVVHAGAVAQADQDQRRVQGHGHEGGRRHADVLAARAVRRAVVRGHQHHTRGQPGHGGAELVVAHPLSMGDGDGTAVAGGVVCNTRGTLVSAVRARRIGPGTEPGPRTADQAARRPACAPVFAFRKATASPQRTLATASSSAVT